MRVNLDDPALRARAVDYLRRNMNTRASVIAAHLQLNQVSCDRLLRILSHEGLVVATERAAGFSAGGVTHG